MESKQKYRNIWSDDWKSVVIQSTFVIVINLDKNKNQISEKSL